MVVHKEKRAVFIGDRRGKIMVVSLLKVSMMPVPS